MQAEPEIMNSLNFLERYLWAQHIQDTYICSGSKKYPPVVESVTRTPELLNILATEKISASH